MITNYKERVWNEQYVFGDPKKDEIIDKMATALGKSRYFAVLLYNRGYRTAEDAMRFLHFEEENLHDPYLLCDMEKATERIFRAIDSKEKICVYGDYDVDGVTAVSTLYLYLTSLGADVSIKIPKREGEGYGVSRTALHKLADLGIQLIITVDTGITACDEVDYAKELGMEFVITDHHECREILPNACAVVNPHRRDCAYPFKELAGVGVVFKLVCALEIKRCRAEGRAIDAGLRDICLKYIDLVTLGTIADVMPIVDENRLIVSMGLKLMENSARPGLRALIDAASAKKIGEDSKKRKINSSFIGFGIAPRINAAGRISDAAIAVKALLANEEDAPALAEELCEINRQRQVEENRIAEEAYEMIQDLADLDENPVIVLDSNEWQQGIIGIVASKITEKYGLPSILVSFDYTSHPAPFDEGRGSGRSIKGLNLVEALNYCEDLLIKHGGHELAAGLTIRRSELDNFRDRINEYARTHLSDETFKITMDADCELDTQDINLPLAKELQLLEPYGTGNSTPLFVLKDAIAKKIVATKGGDHTRMTVEKNGKYINAMYFGVAPLDLGFFVGDKIDLLFNLDINDYKNVFSEQLTVRDARIAKSCTDVIEHAHKRYEEVRAGGAHRSEEDFVPTRDDCAIVYTFLRREYRNGQYRCDLDFTLKLINQECGGKMNYVKLKYIFEILNELKICDIREGRKDEYVYEVNFQANKTSIEKSSILKKLKSQCVDRC
ncbi:MAG: single-stranded-DNA-specific exonuclease RecJ [Ruminococcaceae bacterium]|nr:single-stranded-DNA-specific exonuclease RecJ [Oscillospiraceae bacterium]